MATLAAGASTIQLRLATGDAIAGTPAQLISLLTTTEDFNAFLDAEKTKLTGIATAATAILLGTKQATTSGTAFDFTGIAAGAKRITISFQGVSLSGTDDLLVQIGDAGGFEVTNYISASVATNGVGVGASRSSVAGFILTASNAGVIVSGHMVLNRMDAAHLWIGSHCSKDLTTVCSVGGGDKTLSAELTQVRITRTGTDTFDAGSVNIMVE